MIPNLFSISHHGYLIIYKKAGQKSIGIDWVSVFIHYQAYIEKYLLIKMMLYYILEFFIHLKFYCSLYTPHPVLAGMGSANYFGYNQPER